MFSIGDIVRYTEETIKEINEDESSDIERLSLYFVEDIRGESIKARHIHRNSQKALEFGCHAILEIKDIEKVENPLFPIFDFDIDDGHDGLLDGYTCRILELLNREYDDCNGGIMVIPDGNETYLSLYFGNEELEKLIHLMPVETHQKIWEKFNLSTANGYLQYQYRIESYVGIEAAAGCFLHSLVFDFDLEGDLEIDGEDYGKLTFKEFVDHECKRLDISVSDLFLELNRLTNEFLDKYNNLPSSEEIISEINKMQGV